MILFQNLLAWCFLLFFLKSFKDSEITEKNSNVNKWQICGQEIYLTNFIHQATKSLWDAFLGREKWNTFNVKTTVTTAMVLYLSHGEAYDINNKEAICLLETQTISS